MQKQIAEGLLKIQELDQKLNQKSRVRAVTHSSSVVGQRSQKRKDTQRIIKWNT